MHALKQRGTLKQRYGEWALVTGASDGIGRAFAIELAKAGMSVVLVARRHEKLQEVEAYIKERYAVAVRVLPADLSRSEDVSALLVSLKTEDIGVLVAAAGFGTSGPFIESNLNTELEMIDVNCRSLAHLTHCFGRKFAERRRGGIVLMSSLVAFQGVPRAANYAATKAYVQSLAEGVQQELRSLGVDVLAVAPGPVNSGFGARANMNISRAQTPQEVASGALKALGKSSLVRPGLLAKVLEFALTPLPRIGRVKIMAQVMSEMTKHQVHRPLSE